jgi:hypothetical protein
MKAYSICRIVTNKRTSDQKKQYYGGITHTGSPVWGSEYKKRTYSTLENANKSLEFLMPFGTDKNHCYEDDFEHIKFQIETI